MVSEVTVEHHLNTVAAMEAAVATAETAEILELKAVTTAVAAVAVATAGTEEILEPKAVTTTAAEAAVASSVTVAMAAHMQEEAAVASSAMAVMVIIYTLTLAETAETAEF